MPANAPSRVKYHNRTKVLLCYLLAWGLALLLPYLGLRFVYPYKLAGAAPELSQSAASLPFALPDAVRGAVDSTVLSAGMDRAAIGAALTARDLVWRYVVGGLSLLAWALSLMWQLIWRAAYLRPRQAARSLMRAVWSYRWSMAGIWVLNLLFALAVYWVGVRFIAGLGFWDFLLYFGGFALNPLAAALCFRLGAPPALSGRHAFFKRL